MVEIHEERRKPPTTICARTTFETVDEVIDPLPPLANIFQNPREMDLTVFLIPTPHIAAVILSTRIRIFEWHAAIIHTLRHGKRHVTLVAGEGIGPSACSL